MLKLKKLIGITNASKLIIFKHLNLNYEKLLNNSQFKNSNNEKNGKMNE